MRHRSDASHAAYKSQRNVCTSLRRKSLKEYFRKKSDEMILGNTDQEFSFVVNGIHIEITSWKVRVYYFYSRVEKYPKTNE